MTTINSGEIPFIIQSRPEIDGEMMFYNGNTGERLTAAEAEALKNMGGNTAPVGDKLQTKTPQAGEHVKIRKKCQEGGKYYVQDELSNTYEVDKKTYDNLHKGKGFVDGGQLKPTDKKISKFTNKEVDRLKGEQSQARREVQRAASEAENAVKEQMTLAEQKEVLKKEYDAAKKEMKEAKKALINEIGKVGGNTEEASLKYKTAKTKFDAVSREYKSCSTHFNNALGKTKRAVTTLENAKTRSAEITKTRDAVKAAEAKATAEAQAARQARHDAKVVKPTGGNVPPAEPHTPKAVKVQPAPNAPTEATPMGRKAVLDAKQGGTGVPENATRVTGNPEMVYNPVEGATPKVAEEAVAVEKNAQNAVAKVADTTAKAEGVTVKVAEEAAAVEKNAQKTVAEVAEAAAKTEGAATNTSRAINEVSHVKGGGKLGKILALGAAAVAVGVGLYAYFGKKSDDELQEEVANEVADNNAQAGAIVDDDDDTANAVDTTANVPSAGEVEAAQAENAQDLQNVEADTAEANQPIVVQAGDNLWSICRDKLKAEHNGAEPTSAEIMERVGETMAKNGLKYEIDGKTVLIHVNDELKV